MFSPCTAKLSLFPMSMVLAFFVFFFCFLFFFVGGGCLVVEVDFLSEKYSVYNFHSRKRSKRSKSTGASAANFPRVPCHGVKYSHTNPKDSLLSCT